MIKIISIITESAWRKILTFEKNSRDILSAIEEHDIVLPNNIDIFGLEDFQKDYLKQLVASNRKNIVELSGNNLIDYYLNINSHEILKTYNMVLVVDEDCEKICIENSMVVSVLQVLNDSRIGCGLYWFVNGCKKLTSQNDRTEDYISWFKSLFANEDKVIITDRYFFSDKAQRAINNYFMPLFKIVGSIEINYDPSTINSMAWFKDKVKKNNIKVKYNSVHGDAYHGRHIDLKNYTIKLDNGIDTFFDINPKEKTQIELIKKK